MASDEYGSTDTLSSTTSSEASENYPPKTMVLRRKKVINLNVSNVSGYFAYGSRSAKIQVAGGENSANATSPQTETLTAVGGAEYDRQQQETEYDKSKSMGLTASIGAIRSLCFRMKRHRGKLEPGKASSLTKETRNSSGQSNRSFKI
ncbi:hypothetical protein ABFA07_013339 [Porites harrisoni]